MRIAFDVKGTIEGPKGKEVLELFKLLAALGHEMFVWSNSFGYAVDAVKKYNLNAKPTEKFSKYDAQDYGYDPMDLAIEDDRGQFWLAADIIVFVDDLRDNTNENMELIFHKLKDKSMERLTKVLEEPGNRKDRQ